jgi:hypothetical protein
MSDENLSLVTYHVSPVTHHSSLVSQMSTNPTKKPIEILAKLGISLSDESAIKRLHELRSQKSELSNYLAKTERYKNNVSSITYEKVRDDYQKRLQEVSTELEEKEKKLNGELDAMIQKRDELVKMVKPVALEYEELKFRCMVGEYTKAAFLSLASDKLAILREQKEKLLVLSERSAFYRTLLNLQQESPEPTESIPLEIEDFEVPAEEVVLELSSFQPVEEDTVLAGEIIAPEVDVEDFEEFNFDSDKEIPSEKGFSEVELATAGEDLNLEQIAESEQAFLILKEDGQEDKPFMLLPEESLTIGRAKDNTLRVDDDSISRYHAKVSFETGQPVIRDLGSANGTFVNGKRITEQVLSDNDMILVGERVKLVFKKL